MQASGWDTDQRRIAAIVIITTSDNWSDHIFLHLPLGSAGEASPGLEMAQDTNQNSSTLQAQLPPDMWELCRRPCACSVFLSTCLSPRPWLAL